MSKLIARYENKVHQIQTSIDSIEKKIKEQEEKGNYKLAWVMSEGWEGKQLYKLYYELGVYKAKLEIKRKMLVSKL